MNFDRFKEPEDDYDPEDGPATDMDDDSDFSGPDDEPGYANNR
jgi:hypothetical protein